MPAADAAARLRAHFGWDAPPPPGSRPALIVLSGLPGTGKSHLAQAIAARQPVVVVRSDEVRKALYREPQYTSGENGMVYLTCYALLEQLLRDGHAVVFDATNLLKDGRKRLRAIGAQTGAPSLLLLTVAPPDVIAERLARRAAGGAETYSSDADLAVHEKLAGTVERITEPYTVVDTSQPLEPVQEMVDAFLAGQPPDNPVSEPTAREEPR